MCIVLARLIFSITMPARNELAGFLPGPLICGREILKRRGKAFSFDISRDCSAGWFYEDYANSATVFTLDCVFGSENVAHIRIDIILCSFSMDTSLKLICAPACLTLDSCHAYV